MITKKIVNSCSYKPTGMLLYQTIAYEGEKFDKNFGWDFGNIILFKSKEYYDPWDAMDEFNKFQLPHKPWFGYMRVLGDDEIIEEVMYDTSTVRVDYQDPCELN